MQSYTKQKAVTMERTDTKYGLTSQIKIWHLRIPFSKKKNPKETTKPLQQKNPKNKPKTKNNKQTKPPSQINRKISHLFLISWCHILKSRQWKCHLGTILNVQATPVIRIEHKTILQRHRMEKISRGHKKITCTGFLGNCISGKKSPWHDIYHPVAILYQVDKPFHKAKYNLLFNVRAFQAWNPMTVYLLSKLLFRTSWYNCKK